MTERSDMDTVDPLGEITVTVSVPAELDAAFTAFTEGFGGWWPEKQGFTGAPLETVGFEPAAGALWAERTVDGSEMKWGRVLRWEPPRRVVLSWELTADWATTDGPELGSEIEVVFTAESAESSTVVLTHRGFDRHGDGGSRMRADMASDSAGWPYLIDAYRRSFD